MTERPIQIMSVNVNRQSFLTHILLQTCTADILLVQEPWIGTIQTARSDTDPLGTAIPGATGNNMWDILLPTFTDPDDVRVAIFVKFDIARTFSINNLTSHPLATVNLMVVDFAFEEELLRIINVYHRVPPSPPSHHNLLHLFSSSIDPLIPTLLLGDFNTHSHIWSFPYSTISPWASELVDWFDDQGLELLNPPRVATWESGRNDRHPSVLDLALINEAAAISGQISDLQILFDESISSDHAALRLLWYPAEAIALAPPPELSGFVIDELLRNAWVKIFHSCPSTPISDATSLDLAAQQLHADMDHASAENFKPRHAPDPRGVRWWNPDCDIALHSVHASRGTQRKEAVKHLRRTIAASKRNWSHSFLHQTTPDRLWEAAAWRNGHSIKRIPPLLVAPARLSDDIGEMTQAFKDRFFITDHPNVDPFQAEDPPPLPPRDLPPITQAEISAAIATTSNKSAPGLSGIGYWLLKWAFESRPDRFLDLFNSAITLGHHPWSDALVVVIPKPAKPDYSLPKAYRPISLLECCGKLLEKIIAKRILNDIHHHNILPPTQFGSREYHCAVDAALCLVHNAQATIRAGLVASVVLFNISGFFDNVNIRRTVHIFRNLGFPPSLCSWVESFLSHRNVRLSFNGLKSDPIHLNHGTPQGSPLSPILSAIYTSPLLKFINSTWSRRGLNMYVDDGAIFSNAKNHQLSALNATKGLQEITAWLGRNGLKCDSDKTEFISFSPYRAAEHLVGRTISSIHPRTSATTSYTIERSSLIRYLGVFIHERFDWTHHVTIMANRARSTIRALSILGNSVRGLDYANWRKLFHALVLPVLTYRFPLYSTQPRNKGLLDILQVAQNDMVRKMSGAFKTTPIVPLHYMMAIPPLPLTIKKLTSVYRLHIQRLLPSSLIRTITLANPSADWHLSLNPPTALTRLLPDSFLPFFLPKPLYDTHWSHPQFRDHSAYTLTAETKQATKLLISIPSPDIFHLFIRILTIPSPPFAASFLLFRGQTLVHSGATSDPSRLRALFSALCNGLTYASLSNHVRIFLLDLSLSPYLFHFHKHPLLDLSYSLRSILTAFFDADPLHHADAYRYSIKWSGLPGMARIDSLSEEQQAIVFPLPPPSLITPKAQLLRDWQNAFDLLRRDARYWQSIIRPDGEPPPFYKGALSRLDRRTASSAVQLAFDHAFTATYSELFRPHSGDNTLCPEHTHHITPPSPITEQHLFDRLMRDFLDPRSYRPPSLSPSPHYSRASLPRPQRLSPRGVRQRLSPSPTSWRNTTDHVLFRCPSLTSPRRRFFGTNAFDTYVFGTFDGAVKLGNFQRATNRLLRPLPPRPDPP